VLTKYDDCLRCGEPTWRGANIDPMPADDLKALEAEVEAVARRQRARTNSG
jgi:hypothetical protein